MEVRTKTYAHGSSCMSRFAQKLGAAAKEFGRRYGRPLPVEKVVVETCRVRGHVATNFSWSPCFVPPFSAVGLDVPLRHPLSITVKQGLPRRLMVHGVGSGVAPGHVIPVIRTRLKLTVPPGWLHFHGRLAEGRSASQEPVPPACFGARYLAVFSAPLRDLPSPCDQSNFQFC